MGVVEPAPLEEGQEETAEPQEEEEEEQGIGGRPPPVVCRIKKKGRRLTQLESDEERDESEEYKASE